MYTCNFGIFGGHLTKDADVRTVKRNDRDLAVARMTVAINRPVGEQADFVPIVAFGAQASFVGEHLKKGDPILVTGTLQTGSYTNKEGQKVFTTEVIADHVTSEKDGNLNWNQQTVFGRLTKDPDIRMTADGKKVARFTLASPRRKFKGQQETETDFLNIVCFDKQAEFVEKFFAKGKAVCVSGRVRTGNYTNKEGVKVYTTDVAANEVRFAKKATASESDADAIDYSDGPAPAAETQTVPTAETQTASTAAPVDDPVDIAGNFMNLPDEEDELPFS